MPQEEKLLGIIIENFLFHIFRSVLRSLVNGHENLSSPKTIANDTQIFENSEEPVATITSSDTPFQTKSDGILGLVKYETILIILQDLAAAELEEAFDCVDLVSKEANSAKIFIDDGQRHLER